MQILIVDDDRIQRHILSKQLGQLGYTVREADDGALAWAMLQEAPAPIVVTNWSMPGFNGPELIARIRAARFPGYTYVILLTAKDGRDNIVRGLDAGADDYLIKPCDPSELRARVAIAARIVDLEMRLRTARDTDGLTGLLNRMAIANAVEIELARAGREGTSAGVALLDVDYFKQVNDQHGHQVGDMALRHVAVVVARNIRPYDLLGRWGGEELLLLLPRTTLAEATAVAERVCAGIAAAPIDLGQGRQLRLSASLGVANTAGDPTCPLDTLVQRADAALYQAKAAGRNCVRAAQPPNRAA